ncbi:hypothetical protein HZB07_02080 [Candidatus Saganbacteria bacterium]|nr:hypothetical protein [Candidatus Saganbacteria bacterium]
MIKRVAIIVIFLTIITATYVFATDYERGISPAVKNDNPPFFQELYRLKIVNQVDGSIEVSSDGGFSWQLLGHVLYPTEKISQGGFAAAKWVDGGQVAATAVNAIHIKTGQLDKDKTIFSILPREMLQSETYSRPYNSPNSSIYTDITAGTEIFGGGQAPYVGNQVFLTRFSQPMVDLPDSYIPKIGDTLIIVVDRPLPLPKEIIFENRFGGHITLTAINGSQRIIGEVLRPVSGVGRFAGGVYASPGRIRANHPGVIDVSCAPRGSVGGFQIVPALHGQEMGYVKLKTQWLVIGPVSSSEHSLEGIGPLFKYFIQPNYTPDALQTADWQEKLLGRYLVQVKFAGNNQWQPMPVFALNRSLPLPAWADTALDKVSHIRILFPVE